MRMEAVFQLDGGVGLVPAVALPVLCSSRPIMDLVDSQPSLSITHRQFNPIIIFLNNSPMI